MKKLIVNTIGKGDINLILLHGWVLNSKIWYPIINILKEKCTLYLIDLPGYGKNYKYQYINFKDIIYSIYTNIPKNSILMGWSLGGLIAQKIIFDYPDDILGIITVSSSPCFLKKKNWPGVTEHLFKKYYHDIKKNYFNTIKNFLVIHTKLGNSKDTINNLIDMMMLDSKPDELALKYGLDLLIYTDLRNQLIKSNLPFLRIYGKLDNIVPYDIKNILDQTWPNTYSVTLMHSAHVPFISQSQQFCNIILKFFDFFKKKINKFSL
ncbi:MAG: pimeloyl-ACP methyl ester esterase BioH [Buchnera aphidicola (Eriosoma harunire)]